MLTCREAEKLVMPFIDHELDEDELEQFLRHIHSCPACHEELEIYYTVFLGLRQLDDGSGAYDIAGALEDSLDFAWLTVRTIRLRRIVCYAADALGVTGLLTALLLQLRIWMQAGIF